jgi:GTP-binding protein HflX
MEKTHDNPLGGTQRKMKERVPELPEETRIKRQDVAVLAGLIFRSSGETHDRPLEELALLAETAGFSVGGMLVQKARKITPGTFIGTGKIVELKELADKALAGLVIFDNELSGMQARNIEKEIGLSVIDRTELILQIFAQHARSAAAKMQVELAQQEYDLPRLRSMWTHLDRTMGGVGGRGGTGEQQLETDRRAIEKKISDLKRKIGRLSEQRERLVSQRRDHFTVSIVGYTNAGKSTLMNALTGAGVFVDPKLFATLDTKTKLWEIGGRRKVLLSDTVGFIRNIPHRLIASFHATLEEVRQADLLLHVVDASAPDPEIYIKSVEKVLDEIGVLKKPSILCLNKTDLLTDRVEIGYLKGRYPNAMEISAKMKRGLDELANRVLGAIEKGFATFDILVDPANGRLIAELSAGGELINTVAEDGKLKITARMSPDFAEKISRRPGIEIVRS